MELFEVSDPHQVHIYVNVPQISSAEVKLVLAATFEMPQFAGQKFQATVVTAANAMDPVSHSMLVELQTDNRDGKFFAGVYCQVHFVLPSDPNAIRVPATALVPVDQGAQVAVLGGDNKVAMNRVKLGRDFGDSVEVLAGPTPSDRVIDSLPETLQPGDTVQLKPAVVANSSPQS